MSYAFEASIDWFQYPRATQPAIRDVDLRVREGEFVVITGTAGAGKTTLCHCLAGAIPHFINGSYRGSVQVNGRSLAELRLPEIAGLVGFMQQRPENQLFNRTVEEDVAFGPENLGVPADEIRARVERSLDFVGMSALAQRICGSLSGGETQRVVLACILAMEPALYILDQPAAELDPLGRKQIYENIYRLNHEMGKTIVLVEDRLSDVLPYASRMILIQEGQIVKDAAPEEFFADERVLSSDIRLPDGVKSHPLSRGPRPLADTEVGHYLAGARRNGEHPHPRSGGRPCPPEEGPGQAVQIHALSFRYPGSDHWAIKNVSLKFKKGEFTAIVGENGAGKTTLAKHLIGLLRPTGGEVIIEGKDTHETSTARLSDAIGYLFQDPDLQIFSSSVFDEVAFSLKIRKVPKNEIATRVNGVLDRMGLLELSQCHPYLLSRGQRQRLALASILVHGPPILVVDEPSAGLDYRETIAILDMLAEFCAGSETVASREGLGASGGCVIMISHDMEMVLRYSDRVVAMAGGQVVVDTGSEGIAVHAEAMAKAGIELPEYESSIRRIMC